MDAAGIGWGDLMRRACGWALMVLGIAGCVLPVIPGIPLLIAGLIILGRDYEWARSALHRVKQWVETRRKASAKRAAAVARSRAGVSDKGVGEA